MVWEKISSHKEHEKELDQTKQKDWEWTFNGKKEDAGTRNKE